MDSRLLNGFHDDPFDGNYVKFDTDTQFWSNDSGTLGLQLAETLHGILPIAPTEVISSSLFSNSISKEGDYFVENKNNLNTNSKIYENYDDVTSVEIINNKQLSSKDSIKIVSVDPNSAYNSDSIQSADNIDDDLKIKEDEEECASVFDNVSSCSRSTFRSRTDSSSIGDYESHSSDYDDYSEAVDFETDPKKLTTKRNNNCTLSSDGNDIKKSNDDIDSFAMQLDVNTFDLAAFITQDDQVFYNHSTLAANAALRNNVQDIVKPTISSDIDSDSDVIVDVETVENEEIDSWYQGKSNEIQYLDNIKQDSSKHKVEKKETKLIEPNFSQFSIVPCQRQSVILKRKFGIGLGKNINMHNNPLQVTTKSEEKNRSKQSINEEPAICVKKKRENTKAQIELIPQIENKTENINKNQDSKLVKMNTDQQNPKELVDQKQMLTYDKSTVFNKNEPMTIKLEPKEENNKFLEDVIVASEAPKKRKLNLEEYKKRRENPSILSSIIKNTNEQLKTESSIRKEIPTVKKHSNTFQTIKPSQNEAITSIVKSLKENQSKQFVDPITEAKNKVLRLQELKKAQQIKIIDSTVSSKVARVTKLLPLKDIVKGSHKTCGKDIKFQNSEYEEIIIVSTSCNTDISIPPNGYNTVQQNTATNSSRSLLKSNVLLANISSSFQKVRSDESIKISTNSLIVSIQDVVVRKSSPLLIASSQEPTSSMSSAHGEDKIIMHLRKDRIRKRCVSKFTQTDLLPEFSVLLLPRLQSSDHRFKSRRKTKLHRKHKDRQNLLSSDDETSNYRTQGNLRSSRSMSKYSRHRSSISSSYSESEDYFKNNHRYSGSSSRSRGCSISSTEHRSRSESFDRIYNRKSRSRSKSSSRSMSKLRDASSHVERSLSAPAVEERRIVYVGRIEQDITKEMLRKKFISYGPIKQITIHYKDTGMKYGFVTYEKSEDAFRVIDSGQKDDKINMYDISFGGRRAFCRASYADLDNAGINSCQSYDVHRHKPPPKEEDSFEALLLKVKAKLNATKSTVAKSKT